MPKALDKQPSIPTEPAPFDLNLAGKLIAQACLRSLVDIDPNTLKEAVRNEAEKKAKAAAEAIKNPDSPALSAMLNRRKSSSLPPGVKPEADMKKMQNKPAATADGSIVHRLAKMSGMLQPDSSTGPAKLAAKEKS